MVQLEKKREVYIDVIKIIACFLVIVNHTNNTWMFTSRSPSPTWFIAVTYFFISKPAVPLFIMASGAVLLGKNDSASGYAKRVLRVVIVLLVFSAFYFFTKTPAPSITLDNVLLFFTTVISQNVTNAYWYLYLYIGLLLMLPVLNILAKTLDDKAHMYIFVITIGVAGLLPIIAHYIPQISFSSHITAPLLSCEAGLFLAGYSFHTRSKRKAKTCYAAVICYFTLLMVMVFGTYFEYLKNAQSYLFYDNRSHITITLSAICIFYIVKHLFYRSVVSDKAASIIKKISVCTFGIYLLSDFFIAKFQFVLSAFFRIFHPMIAIVAFQIVVFTICYIVTYLLRLIPFVRKYV